MPRDGSAMTAVGNNLYVFGGTNGQEKFNDLWSFNLQNKTWTRINLKINSVVPLVRKGHSFINFRGKLILFGGFHDLT